MPNFTVVALKITDLTDPKIAKIANFWYNFAKKGGYPQPIFTKFGMGRVFQVRTLTRQILPFWLSKCGLTAQKIAQNGNFWYKLPQRGIPLSDIYKILPGEEATGPHPRAKFHRCSFINVAVRLQKSPKVVIFCKNLPLEKKIMGVDRKT